MRRRRWAVPAGALAAVLVIAALAGIVGGTLLALRGGDSAPVEPPAVITVFLRQSATPAQVRAIEAKIKDAPGLESFRFFTREGTLDNLLAARPEVMLPRATAAASYVIRVNDGAAVYNIAQRFFYDPAVNSDPGTHNGVWVVSRLGAPPAHTGIKGRVLTAGGPAPGVARPYPASEVKIIDSSGRVIAVVPAGPSAAFKVDLIPGEYAVEARPTSGNPQFQLEKATVEVGRYTTVDLYAQIR